MATKYNFQNVFKVFLNHAINSIPTTPAAAANIIATAPCGVVGKRPFHNKAGVFKLLLVSASSLYLGGLIAHKGASYLEENEIFVPTDEDDDD